MNVHSCSVIRAAERTCFATGKATSDDLMDAVIERLWDALRQDPEFAPHKFGRIDVYAGKGNNAGDAVGLAACFGKQTCTGQVKGVGELEECSPEMQRQFAKLKRIEPLFSAPAIPPDATHTLIIDGLLGSGARGPLSGTYARFAREINERRECEPNTLVLSIDIPTGLDADTGAADADAVRADVTAVIGCVKPGMLADGAENYVGRLLCIPLPEVELPTATDAVVMDAAMAHMLRRSYSCFKNKAGRVHIVAGSIGYLGAAQLCAEAAVAAGAGLVALYCKEDIYPILAARVAPEVMVHPVRSFADVPTDGAQALVIGPGIGQPDATEVAALQQLLSQFNGPVVLDADGLNLAAKYGWLIPANAILTPHPGEMRRLFPSAATLSRVETVSRFLQAVPCTLLYKGARSIIASHDCPHFIYNSTGGPYMANGGQGDVLSGAIAALVAQGVAPVYAAARAAYFCGLAATHAKAAGSSATASEVIRCLPIVVRG